MNSKISGQQETIIRPPKGYIPINFVELWKYRELLYFLIWRDIKVRYKQTALGALWAIIQPFFLMIVFSIFFGKLAKMPSDGVPYPIFAYAALLPWQLFSNALTQCGNSLINEQNLIRKVYFPRLIIPMASVLSSVVDFTIAFGMLIIMMLYYQIRISSNIIVLPLLITMIILTSLGVGIFISSLNVKYRDFRYILPFVVQFWMFVSPVVYSSKMIPENWQILYGINPMVGVIDGFRWALLGSSYINSKSLIASFSLSILILGLSLLYFRRVENKFADII